MGDHAQDHGSGAQAGLTSSSSTPTAPSGASRSREQGSAAATVGEVPICAIATAPGRGGIGVVRVSGFGLWPIIQAICGRRLDSRRATYLSFLDGEGGEIDRGIALWFDAPNSFTGEQVLELQGHGGPVVLQLLLRRLLQAGESIGLRLAEPGEFTRRAFLNDKLDLAQVEAVADLIDASSEQAARSASRSLAGEFSRRIHALVQRLIDLRMLVEATLDFPEEEIDFLKAAQAGERLSGIRGELDAVLRTARQGALLREGMNVVLIGAPNVGKSSLLNALAGDEVAIVTPVAGTTRDRVSQTILLDGVPLNVIDTAGLRDTDDEVERIGVERSWQALSEADAVLWVDSVALDMGADHEFEDAALAAEAARVLAVQVIERIPPSAVVIRVHNKIDLRAPTHEPPVAASRGDGARANEAAEVWLSAKTGDGIDRLRQQLLQAAGWQPSGESPFIARERHLAALRTAGTHLGEAETMAARGSAQLELFAEELRLAQSALSAITGEFSADDLLGEIFGRFCIGK